MSQDGLGLPAPAVPVLADRGSPAHDRRSTPGQARDAGYRLVIFDLDGVLADSFAFFVASQHRLAALYGFRTVAEAEMEQLRGRPAREVMRHIRLPGWKLPFVVRGFRRMMRAEAARIARFDGVDTALAALHDSGVVLALVSSNAQDNCRLILGEANWRRFSHVACGVSMFGKLRPLRRVLRAAGVAATDAVYVGDQASDGEAAHAAGMAFAAVGWGYASADALRALAPAHLFDDVAQLASLAGPARR